MEGSELWGAGLTRFLLDAGEDIREVPTPSCLPGGKATPRPGQERPFGCPGHRKSGAREECLPSPRRPAVAEELKLLTYRDQLRRARNQLTNRIHKDLGVAYPGYHTKIQTWSPR